MKYNDYLLGLRNTFISKEENFKVGDALSIRYEVSGGRWKVRKFSGICISITKKGLNLRYTLRNVIKGSTIEMSFYSYSPMLLSLSKLPVQKFSKIRTSKLFLLRKQALKKSTIKF